VPALLRQYGLRADHRLGQNFLVEETALQSIVQAAEISGQDIVLEIGPGLGNLTRHLAAHARQVIAVEIDAELIAPLQQVTGKQPNVQVIQSDILDLEPDLVIPADDYLVVANIPYYITSAIIRHLLSAAKRPKRIVLTIQEEVARRICAAPGEMSLLALSVQVFGVPRVTGWIPAGAFYPPPKVDSAVVRIDLFPEPFIEKACLDAFFRLARAGFGQKRKTLRNALSAGLALLPARVEERLIAAGVDPRRRAESLSLAEWAKVTASFSEKI
jgi:16S rRNA (adenine1518-N6/adenine1519-N6)-dimethyltransferase